MNNKIFSDNIPTVPRWSGPPYYIIEVQALLYASLATSLFSAFLAMLGKQWLNRYASTGARGTAVERGRDRQQKFNGIITWYFEYVMESPPLMLQAALLLLGCAICRYLWEINTTVALIILAITSFGVIFYCFIVVAGAVFTTCPYQTPASRALRVTVVLATSVIASTPRHVVRGFATFSKRWQQQVFGLPYDHYQGSPWDIPHQLLKGLVCGVILIVQAIVKPPVAFFHWVYTYLYGVLSTPAHGPDQQIGLLDSQSILWVLNTSLDKDNHLSVLESLATTVLPPDLDPTIVVGCSNILYSCMKFYGPTAVCTQGLEQLATASATCLLYTLSIVGPTPTIIKDLYHDPNPLSRNVLVPHSLQFSHIMSVIGNIYSSSPVTRSPPLTQSNGHFSFHNHGPTTISVPYYC